MSGAGRRRRSGVADRTEYGWGEPAEPAPRWRALLDRALLGRTGEYRQASAPPQRGTVGVEPGAGYRAPVSPPARPVSSPGYDTPGYPEPVSGPGYGGVAAGYAPGPVSPARPTQVE